MNFVILTGRLTKTPELKKTPTGSTVLSFSLAVDRGDKARTTDFIRCEAWGKTADFIAKYFDKGSPVEINGALRVDKYEKDGRMVELVKVLVNNAAFPIRTNNLPDTTEREKKTANAGDIGGVEF